MQCSVLSRLRQAGRVNLTSVRRRSGRTRQPAPCVVMDMEDSRCKIAAIEIEHSRCKELWNGIVIEAEDSRCKNLVTRRTIEIEDPRCSLTGMKMEDPRCGGLLGKW